MKNWIFGISISLALMGLSLGVILGNEHLLNYLLFASIVFLPLACIIVVTAFCIAIQADEGDKEAIDNAKKLLEGYNKGRSLLGFVAMMTALCTALYFSWIMTAVLFAVGMIINCPTMGLLQRAARCEPSFGDETIDALRQDAV